MNTTVILSNLPLAMDSIALEDMFGAVGNVRKAHVLCDPFSGLSLGRGRVEMSTREEAENCVLHFNQQSFKGQRLIVYLT